MRLLLVEDDQELAGQLQAQLTQSGYAIDHACDARDADYLLKHFDYELVILDLGLPDQEGLDLLRSWRQAKRKTPILILTGRDAWYERVDGLKAGADDYMGKPFHYEELLARVQVLIRRAHDQESAQIQQGDLILNENKQSLSLNGKTIPLTGSEYRLLHYLFLHPGQVLSKDLIREQLYDLDQEIGSNTVEVYILRIRQKIGSDYIQTRRGQGYVFQANK